MIRVISKSGFISESLTMGGELHIQEILGGNIKTHLAVYEEGLFDVRGGPKGGPNAPSSPQKNPCECLNEYMHRRKCPV